LIPEPAIYQRAAPRSSVNYSITSVASFAVNSPPRRSAFNEELRVRVVTPGNKSADCTTAKINRNNDTFLPLYPYCKQEGQHPLTGQRTANLRLLANQ